MNSTQRTTCSADMAWRTAIKRTKLSKPLRWLREQGLLEGRHLDYGCGRGDDADKLGCERYDPHFQPVMPDGRFEVITCNYVLNVIEEEAERVRVVQDIQSRLEYDGCAFIAVRANRKDLKGLTRIGTWQGLVSLNLPVVYKDSDTIIYELRADSIICNAPAKTFGGSDAEV